MYRRNYSYARNLSESVLSPRLRTDVNRPSGLHLEGKHDRTIASAH